MAGVLGSKPLTLEDVSQMPSAAGTSDLGPGPIRVRQLDDGAGNLVVKAGPAASRVELVGGAIEGSVAATAMVGADTPKRFVLAREGAFGPPVFDHCGLGPGQLAPLRGRNLRHTIGICPPG